MPWLAPDHHHAADDVGVTVQILGRRMHHEIEAEFQRSLDPRARERIVGNREHVAPARDLRHRREFDELQQRIAGRLDPDHLRLGTDRRFDPSRIGHVDEAHAQARRALAHVLEQPVRAAVEVVAGDDMCARVERIEDGRHPGQPRREGETAGTAFEIGHAGLQRGPRRIGRARVVVALVHAGTRLDVGRRGVDRCHDRAGRRIGLLARVDGTGREALRACGVRGRVVHGTLLRR